MVDRLGGAREVVHDWGPVGIVGHVVNIKVVWNQSRCRNQHSIAGKNEALYIVNTID